MVWIEALTGLAFASFIIPFLLAAFVWKRQDLKKKYDCDWALVTGASSGIGKVLSERLCEQGINVVMIALDDALLAQSYEELSKRYLDVQIRKVGADLSREGYMEVIKNSTKDISISCVFNNAGYITTGMFADVPIEKHLLNLHCNSTCAVQITHYFLNKMLDSGKKGLVCFTSSPAGCMPSPFAAIYGSSKAFLTEFATSLAPEVKYNGIDVLVVHPSPVASNFYNSVHKISAIAFFQKTVRGPENIVEYMFAAAGRTVMVEEGYFCFFVRGVLLKLIDVAFLTNIITRFIHLNSDYKKVTVQRKKTN